MEGLAAERAEDERACRAFAQGVSQQVVSALRDDHRVLTAWAVGDVIHGVDGHLKEKAIVAMKGFFIDHGGDLGRGEFRFTSWIDGAGDRLHLTIVDDRVEVGLHAHLAGHA